MLLRTPTIGVLVATVFTSMVSGCTGDSVSAQAPNPGAGATTTPPVVTVANPAPGNVSGTVSISANTSGSTGVVGVQFRVNGVNYGSEDTSAPYSVSWNTASLTPGTVYTLSAVARNAAGLTTTSPGVIVTVVAPPPPMPINGTAQLMWDAPTTNADGSALIDLGGYTVHYGTATGNYTLSIDLPLSVVTCIGTIPTTCSHVVNGLGSGTWYFVVQAYDIVGNTSTNSNEAMKLVP